MIKQLFFFLSITIFSSLQGQNVYIPDPNFKSILVNNSEINTNSDGEIQYIEASVYSGELWCEYVNIENFTGIEAFTSLKYFYCRGNQLSTINISSNTALVEFWCNDNQLTNVDITQNTSLKQFYCAYNELTDIDVSQNMDLCELWCSHNKLTKLNLSQHNSLNWLRCNHNLFTCLNIANGQNTFWLSLWTHENPDLECIEVDDADWCDANWLSWDYTNFWLSIWSFFWENCGNDCSNTSSLTELTTSKTLIQILDLMGREAAFKPNTPLIYVYDDGSTEKVFSVE